MSHANLPNKFKERTARILLVDDDPGNLELVRQTIGRIKRPSIETFTATRITEALDILDRVEIDVCLSNVDVTPGESARDLLQSARHHGHRVAFVAVPVHQDEEEVAHDLIIAGFDDVLHRSDLRKANLYRIIRNAWLRNIRWSEVEENALTDSLTGVHNRRSIEARMQVECDRSDRLGERFSVLFVDLNDFKRVNDLHGHLAGDIVLKQVGTTLVKRTRKSDVVGRLGGDEFVVILPATGDKLAESLARELEIIIEQSKINLSDKALQVSAAIGHATYDPEDMKCRPKELIELADQRMYRFKAAARKPAA